MEKLCSQSFCKIATLYNNLYTHILTLQPYKHFQFKATLLIWTFLFHLFVMCVLNWFFRYFYNFIIVDMFYGFITFTVSKQIYVPL